MKIAFILPALKNVGPTIVVHDIINDIINKTRRIDLYYFDEQVELNFPCNTYRINFFDKINFNDYDIVHAHMLRPDLYVWFHRKKTDRCKFISTLHQNIYDNLKDTHNKLIAYIFEKIWCYSLKKFDHIVFLTKILEKKYKTKIIIDSSVIYNGRKLPHTTNIIEELEILQKLKQKNTLIGIHCNLIKRKGIHQVIKILKELENFVLVVIGDGNQRKRLEKMAMDLGVENQCLFLGYKKNAIDYLKYLDFYIMSSYSEGFGLSLIEAAHSKLPIICSDIDVFREIFSSNEVSFFKLDNESSLIKAIKHAVEEKQNLSIKAYNRAISNYTSDIMAKNYLNLYSQLMKNKLIYENHG